MRQCGNEKQVNKHIMKFNWGYKIAAFYLLFVVGIVYLVVRSSMQQIDLVTADYYGEEIRYQDRINETHNAQALSAPVDVRFGQGVITLDFPAELRGKQIEGTAQLYCPADQKKDLTRNISTADNLVKITVPAQNTGFHQLKLKWKADGVNYYFEKNINLN